MAKYALVTEDLNDEQIVGLTDFCKKNLTEVGWTMHKIFHEDFLIDYNAHKLVVDLAEAGNPPKGDTNG